jgi:hypothetical protein
VFLPCTFWLVSCLALQGKSDDAWTAYRRALGCANDLGLMSEEFDPVSGQMLGNFPQGLTHVSQIMARLALAKVEQGRGAAMPAGQGAVAATGGGLDQPNVSPMPGSWPVGSG